MTVQRKYTYVPELRPIRPPRKETAPNRGNYVRYKYEGSDSRWPAQDKMVAFIEKALAAGGPPSIEEIRRHMGWREKYSVKSCLRKIEERGALPAGFARWEMERW